MLPVMPIFQKNSEIRKSENSAENFRHFSGIEDLKTLPKIAVNTLGLSDID